MVKITVSEAKIKLDDLIQAAKDGEEVIIVTDEKETFKLVQVASTRPHPQYGSAEGLFEMSNDFDAPLEAFKKYVPTEQSKPQYRKFGTAKGQFKMSDDFDAPIDDFDEYT